MTRAEQQMAELKRQGFTVIGSYERREGETIVLIACPACGYARSPDHACPSCAFKANKQKTDELRAALEQARAGLTAADLIIKTLAGV